MSCEVLISSNRDDGFWGRELHAQIIVVSYRAEGVERGSAENCVVLVSHLDHIERDDLGSGCEVVAECDSEADLAQGRDRPSSEA